MKINHIEVLTSDDTLLLAETCLERGLEETYQLMEELVQQRKLEEVIAR